MERGERKVWAELCRIGKNTTMMLCGKSSSHVAVITSLEPITITIIDSVCVCVCVRVCMCVRVHACVREEISI